MDLENWMGYIQDQINDRKLSDIVIPGSHDSGSYCITAKSTRTDLLPDLGWCLNPLVSIVGSIWSKTQDHSIADQLKMGIRYVDLRVYLDCSSFYLVHGFEAGLLHDELERIAEFVNTHPTEIVIMDMNHIYKCDNASICSILAQFQEIFGDLLCPPAPEDTDVPTYSEIIRSGKRVIVAITGNPEEFTSSYTHCEVKCQFDWVWCSETDIVSPWANTPDPAALYKFLRERMSRPRPPNTLYVTQTILTPTTADTVWGIFRPPGNLKELVAHLNPLLPSWFNEFSNLHLNISIVDFLDTKLISQLVNLNLTGPVSDEADGSKEGSLKGIFKYHAL